MLLCVNYILFLCFCCLFVCSSALWSSHYLASSNVFVLPLLEQVVARRESHYRVPWQRVAEWRDNPTVYRYGCLFACLLLAGRYLPLHTDIDVTELLTN